jgi:hypothetical protein
MATHSTLLERAASNKMAQAGIKIEGNRMSLAPLVMDPPKDWRDREKRVADAMREKRRELIAQPLDRIWLELARVAIQILEK